MQYWIILPLTNLPSIPKEVEPSRQEINSKTNWESIKKLGAGIIGTGAVMITGGAIISNILSNNNIHQAKSWLGLNLKTFSDVAEALVHNTEHLTGFKYGDVVADQETSKINKGFFGNNSMIFNKEGRAIIMPTKLFDLRVIGSGQIKTTIVYEDKNGDRFASEFTYIVVGSKITLIDGNGVQMNQSKSALTIPPYRNAKVKQFIMDVDPLDPIIVTATDGVIES